MAEERKKNQKKLGRPRKSDVWTAALLSERADRYFAKCDDRTREVMTKDGPVEMSRPEPYSIEGLCVYLDITRRQFDTWRHEDTEIGRRAQKLHLRIAANRVTGALDGTQNASFAQFMLKNNNPEDYREKVEVENTVSAEAAAMFEQWSQAWKR